MLKKLLLLSVLAIAGALPAFADGVSDRVIANLKAQGYEVIQLDRTWLGRMWILARNDEVQREVVFNPTTGEILRDYTVLLASLDPAIGSNSGQQVATSKPTSVIVAGSEGPVAGADVLASPPAKTASDPVQIDVQPINPIQ